MKATDQTQTWVRRYFALFDAGELDESARFFAEDARLRFANSDTIVGRGAIEKVFRDLFESIGGIEHNVTNVWEEEGGVVTLEVDVTYTRKDGGVVLCRGASVSEVADGLIQDQRIYVDISPVFANS
jgi:ketosteroid isomerase-like protein